jgi:enoyl-CoA hydratase/carnithine racemase
VLSEEAERLGLVNAVVEPDALLSYTRSYALGLIATVSAGSLAVTKRQIYTDLHRDIGSSVEEAAALLDRMMAEPDFAEGVAAFREKRAPRY